MSLGLGSVAQSGAILDQPRLRNMQVSENAYFLGTWCLGFQVERGPHTRQHPGICYLAGDCAAIGREGTASVLALVPYASANRRACSGFTLTKGNLSPSTTSKAL